MTRDTRSRVQRCSEAEAKTRLQHARSFYEVAVVASSESGDDLEYASAAASLAGLAGIAATDAACCKKLGQRSRGQDHQQAVALVERIEPGGKQAAAQLRRLLSLKDQAHYGLIHVGGGDLKKALQHAKKLVQFADDTLAP